MFLPVSVFYILSPISDAACLPNWNKFPTCLAVKVKTFLDVFLASYKLALVFSETSTFSAGETALERNPPTEEKPFENNFPVKAKPIPIPFDAPTKTDEVLNYYFSYNSSSFRSTS